MNNLMDDQMRYVNEQSGITLYEGVKHVAENDDWYFWDDTDRKLPRVHMMTENVLNTIANHESKKGRREGLTKGLIGGGIAGGIAMYLYGKYQKRRLEEEYLEDEE